MTTDGNGSPSRPRSPTTRATRVVLADDSEDLREVLRRLLERDGRFEVVGEAGSGDQVVPLIEEQDPDVVVLDLSMPVLDGRETIPLIREASDAVRVVVMSGAGSFDVLGPEGLGADAYLEKGASIERILTTIAEVAASDADR